jgi:hypothetical protein
MLFDVYASRWLERMRIGEIGEAPLADNTHADYLWRLRKYILPFFGPIPVAEISDRHCQDFRAKLFADRDKLLAITKAGGRPTGLTSRENHDPDGEDSREAGIPGEIRLRPRQ